MIFQFICFLSITGETFRLSNRSFVQLSLECQYVPSLGNATWIWIDPLTNVTRWDLPDCQRQCKNNPTTRSDLIRNWTGLVWSRIYFISRVKIILMETVLNTPSSKNVLSVIGKTLIIWQSTFSQLFNFFGPFISSLFLYHKVCHRVYISSLVMFGWFWAQANF